MSCMWLIIDLHLAMINLLKPCFDDVAHQYKWLRMVAVHLLIIWKLFSFPAFIYFFVRVLAICQISK